MRGITLSTTIYSSAANIIQSNYILNVACVFHSCSRLQHFYDLQKFYLETCSEKPEMYVNVSELHDLQIIAKYLTVHNILIHLH